MCALWRIYKEIKHFKVFSFMKWFLGLDTLKSHQTSTWIHIILKFTQNVPDISVSIDIKFENIWILGSVLKLSLIQIFQKYSVSYFNGHYNEFKVLIFFADEFLHLKQISSEDAWGIYNHPLCSEFLGNFSYAFFA